MTKTERPATALCFVYANMDYKKIFQKNPEKHIDTGGRCCKVKLRYINTQRQTEEKKMKQYQIQFSFNEETGKAGEHIGKVAVREQAMKIASAYAKRHRRDVDIFEQDTEINRVTSRWIALAGGGIWAN